MHKVVQTAAVDACVALKAPQSIDLVVQLAQGLAADVTARQNSQDFQECGNRGASGAVVISFAIAEHRMVKELEPEERPHTLRQGLLVVGNTRGGLNSDLSGRFNHAAILRHLSGVWQIGEPIE